jgi:hypothetical protein
MSDPVVLLSEIRAAQTDLGERVDRRGAGQENAAVTPVQSDLKHFTNEFKVAWRDGGDAVPMAAFELLPRPTCSAPFAAGIR